MKEKISITLDSKIVQKLEAIAKKHGFNRSKFIENILIEKLDSTPVLILAAWSEIGKRPKGLITYKDQRLIVRQIEMLQMAGLRNIYVSVSSGELKDYLEKNLPEVKIILERKKIGSGGTLKRFSKSQGTRFVFMHCDILFDLDLNKLIEFHIQEKSDLTLVLKSVKNPSKYGNARLEGNRIIAFTEKPRSTDIFLIYIGIGVVEPHCLDHLDDEGKFELQLDKVKNKLAYIYEGYWKSFETELDLA